MGIRGRYTFYSLKLRLYFKAASEPHVNPSSCPSTRKQAFPKGPSQAGRTVRKPPEVESLLC